MKWYLDFGHGGKDSGAIGSNKTKESDTVLKIGLQIKHHLEKASETVITTRQTDTYHTLDSRSTKANNSNCDYFISLHMNAATNKTAKGCEVWIYDEKSKLYTLAKSITNNLSQKINTPNRGVKISKEFSVLRKTKMPALLIEIDFISNLSVEKEATTDKYIRSVSDIISATLLAHVGKQLILDGTSYTVCLGDYTDITKAQEVLKEANSKGFKNAYII